MSEAPEGLPSAGSTPAAPADPDEGRHRLIEILSAILLGIAGLLTAYAAYQAALADGEALEGYTSSSRSTSDANGYFDEANQLYANDQSLFLDYQLQVVEGNQEVADAIRVTLFPPRLEVATEAWLNSGDDGPPTPLAMPEYVVEQQATAEALSQQATEEFQAAQQTDAAGDAFGLAAVFLAVSLFLGGVASLFKSWPVRIAVLVGGAVFVIPGVVAILQGRAAL